MIWVLNRGCIKVRVALQGTKVVLLGTKVVLLGTKTHVIGALNSCWDVQNDKIRNHSCVIRDASRFFMDEQARYGCSIVVVSSSEWRYKGRKLCY